MNKILKFGKKSDLDEKILIPKVEVIERNVENFTKKVYFLAKLHSNKSIDIMSETDGTIESRAYQIGNYVKKGQIIIQMTDTRKVLELKEIEDLLKASKARLDESSSNYRNSIKLHEKNIIISVDRGQLPPTETMFIVGRIKEALELFQIELNKHAV